MLHDRLLQQLPSVRQECFSNVKDRPRELSSSIQSLHVTSKGMQLALHQLCMLLLRPKVSWPPPCPQVCTQAFHMLYSTHAMRSATRGTSCVRLS